MAIEDVIAEQSVAMADQMLRIAEYAKSEREVELECFAQIKAFCTKAGVKIAGEFDRTIGSGRPDAHYQGLIIEYKDPSDPAARIGPLAESPGTKAVVQQIKGRFPELARELRHPLKRLVGVGCDARMLVFVRFREGRWDVDAPQPVTPHTVERLLRALVSLGAQGRSFIPEYLSADFGSDSGIGKNGVSDLYAVITTTESRKALMFFNQWKILFGEVCGYDVEGKSAKIQKLGDHYGIPDARPAELLFAVHSYYAIFMKFLAAGIAGSFSPLGLSTLKKCVGAPTSLSLRREMESLEQGGIWAQLNITNFLEGDLFSWYLDAWDDRVSAVVRAIVLQLDDYDPTTLSVDPAESRDLLKKLYQQLFPKSVRHDLGEYYTPDWLAEHVLNELGYEGDPDKRLLDPGCGSGTFLVMAINRIKVWYEEHRHECGYGEAELVQKILRNVIGFDLNPLAVMASRTNYLMALRDLLRHATSIEIPVYLCDSIMTPAEYGDLFTGGLATARRLKTSAAEFVIPSEITTSREYIAKYADTLEFCVRNRYSAEDFLARCVEVGLPVDQDAVHRQLYSELRRLDADNQNGIWARIIKNAFAPLFTERVDYVAGNPPWVNWDGLPAAYRKDLMRLNQDTYGLFPHTGLKARHGSSETDISTLMFYVSCDKYLCDGGLLGFVITQSVFMSDAAKGFRRFSLPGGAYLGILSVHDMVRLQPFEDATNRTSTITVRRGDKTKYPVEYVVWEPVPGCESIRPEDGLDEVHSKVRLDRRFAAPIGSDRQSPWLVAGPHEVAILDKCIGKSDYVAHVGVHTGGANAVYWLLADRARSDSHVLVRNFTEGAKKKVEEIGPVLIEKDFVFPYLRGRDVGRWTASPSLYIIAAQDPAKPERGMPENELKASCPLTFEYFTRFKGFLEERVHFRKYLQPVGAPFYSLYDIKRYTYAEFKVVWRYIASEMTCAIISSTDDPLLGRKLVLPDNKLILVPLASEIEAHYLCAMLNSSLSRAIVARYVVSTQIAPHVLENLAVPRFRDSDDLHLQLAHLSMRCHEEAAKGDAAALGELEKHVDKAAAELWQVQPDELALIGNARRAV